VIETERLVLRLPVEEDVPAIIDFYASNRAHLEPWSPAWPTTFLAADYWSDQVAARWAEHRAGHGLRTFILQRTDMRLVGNISLTQIERGPGQYCVMGYGLAESAQGRGYMVEAVRAMVAHAFGVLGLHRVTANYMPHNVRSAAVLRAAGFMVEGYARDYLLINGRWEDHILTAISNPDWSAGKGP
jgi:ribosomal-protein-alanine N-acetyltransferase